GFDAGADRHAVVVLDLRRDFISIAAVAAVEIVLTKPTDQHVIAGTAAQRVVAVAAFNAIVSVAALHVVGVAEYVGADRIRDAAVGELQKVCATDLDDGVVHLAVAGEAQ